MSYAKLEAKIRAEAVQDVARRADKLDRQLTEVATAGGPPGPALEWELQYLERMVAADSRLRQGGLSAQVAGLRERFDAIQARAVELPPSAVISWRSEGANDSAEEEGAVSPIASFLQPRKDAAESADEVRLISVEGRLAEELNRFPVLSVPGSERSLVFRRLRSWNEEDDEACSRRERLAVLELGQAAANIREMQDVLMQQVEQDQHGMDQIEQDIAAASERISQSVVMLASAQSSRERVLTWLAPSVGLLILGGGIISVLPAAAGGCAFVVLVRGSMTMGALGAHALTSQKLKSWQKHALQSLTEYLPCAFDALPSSDVQFLVGAGDEAQRRLLTKLDETGSWSRFHASPMALLKGLKSFCRASDARKGGYAFSTRFKVQGIRARQAFSILQRLSIAGSLDPGCEVTWSRPLDEDSDGTFLRYLIFSNALASRDFYCVCRAAQVGPTDKAAEPAPGAEPRASSSEGEAPSERFVFAVSSLMPELLASTGLPESNKGLMHGNIHITGIVLTDTGHGRLLVQVMADVDAQPPWVVPVWVADSEVRLHVLRTAEHIGSTLRLAAAEAASED